MISTSKINRSKQYLVGSLIALLAPIYFVFAWIYAAAITIDSQARLEFFFNFLPSFLHNAFYLTTIGLICCGMAMLLGFSALYVHKKRMQISALIIMGMAALLGGWLLFSLM